MKRVLVVNTTHTTFNGIVSVMMNYVRKTYQTVNYDFALCGRVEESILQELQALGGMVYIAPCSRVKKPFKYAKWLMSIMKERKYDCIHVHGNSGTMYFEIHAAKKAKVPVRIAHSHNTSCKYVLAHRVLKPMLNREITDAIACSDLAGKWLFKRDFTVLPNGIDTAKFLYSQQTRNSYIDILHLQDKLVIGHVAYMDTEKNHMYLLRVFKELLSKKNDVRLILIGDGRLRSEIERYISENNLGEYVLLLGKRSDVDALYQCMDVFVLPSLYEGLPVTLVEAQAAGLPCIISNNITKQVDLTGRVQYIGIEDENIDEWVNSILNVNVNSEDRIKSSLTVSLSEFNIDKCTTHLLDLYQND